MPNVSPSLCLFGADSTLDIASVVLIARVALIIKRAAVASVPAPWKTLLKGRLATYMSHT